MDAQLAQDEMHSFAHTPVFGELLEALAHGQVQQGAPRGSLPAPLIIGWALAKFPDARLYWFDHCGHFPQWDQPAETVRLILAAVSRQAFRDEDIAAAGSAPAKSRAVPAAAIATAGVVLVAGAFWLLLRRR